MFTAVQHKHPYSQFELYAHLLARDIADWTQQRPVAKAYIEKHNSNRPYVQQFSRHYAVARIRAALLDNC